MSALILFFTGLMTFLTAKGLFFKAASTSNHQIKTLSFSTFSKTQKLTILGGSSLMVISSIIMFYALKSHNTDLFNTFVFISLFAWSILIRFFQKSI